MRQIYVALIVLFVFIVLWQYDGYQYDKDLDNDVRVAIQETRRTP